VFIFRPEKEFDFLIISSPLKSILHIEVKRTMSEDYKQVYQQGYKQGYKEKAFKQLQKGFDFFQETIPFGGKSDWNYVRLVYFALKQNGKVFTSKTCNSFCDNCRPFVLDSTTNFSDWWLNISAQLTTSQRASYYDSSTYIITLKVLLHQMFQQGKCVTKKDLLDYTIDTCESVSSSENIFFWSNVQYNVLSEPKLKRVAFNSQFGTGKTILLKEKAISLIRENKNCKIVFVVFEDSDATKESLLMKTYREEFRSLTANVILYSLKTNGKFHVTCTVDAAEWDHG
jgi:hypothetical protein